MLFEIILNQSVLTGVLVVLLIYLLIKVCSGPSNLPPGPVGFPVVGCIPMLSKEPMYKGYRKLRKKYGDIFSLRLGPKLTVVINGYDCIREAFFKNGDVFSDRPDLYFIKVIFKEKGIGASSGKYWKDTRTFALGTLRDFGFGRKSLETGILEELDVYLQLIEDTNGKPFDVMQTTQISVSNVICSIVFGNRFNHDDEKFKKLLFLLDEANRMNIITGVLSFFPVLAYLPGDPYQSKRVHELFDRLFGFLEDIIQKHRESFDANSPRDYIDSFFACQQKGTDNEIMNDDNLKYSIINLFAAGTQTTQSSIRWAILYMLHNKHVQDRLRKEVDDVIGSSRQPSLNDKPLMPYFEAFLAETLRCGNVAPLSLPHGAKSDIRFMGYIIPKGAIIIPNLDSVLNDPNTFPDPDKFDPTRFLDADGKLCGTDKITPFSIGRRSCLGESLARMELFLFLTSLVQRFRFEPEDENNLPSLNPSDGFARTPDEFKFKAIKVV